MSSAAARYRPCPHCQALNMYHRSACYQCGEELATVDAEAPLQVSANVIDHFQAVLNDLRSHKRVTTCIPGAVAENGSEATVDVLIQDISEGGALFRTDEFFTPGTPLRLFIPFEDRTYAV